MRCILLCLALLSVLLLGACQERATPTLAVTPPVASAEATAEPSPTRSVPTPTPLAILVDGKEVPLYRLNPANVDNATLPVQAIEDLHLTGDDPHLRAEAWKLEITGAVEQPLTLTYQDLLARPAITGVVLLICSGVFADNVQWSGPSLADLLREAGAKPNASELRMTGADGYVWRVKFSEAMAEGTMVATQVNGQPLPSEHGFPARLVFPKVYGSAWVKWPVLLEVLALGSS